MVLSIHSEFNYKLSVEDASTWNIKSGTVYLIALLINEVIFGISETSRALMLGGVNSISIIRCITVASLVYVTLKKAENSVPDPALTRDTDGGIEKESKIDDEEKEKKHFSPLEIWSQFYAFRNYFIPAGFAARIYLFIFIGLIGVDSFIDLYSSITYRRICKDIHVFIMCDSNF